MLSTAEQALEACEKAGYEPRTQANFPDGTIYLVCLDGDSYTWYYGENMFLGWANEHFKP